MGDPTREEEARLFEQDDRRRAEKLRKKRATIPLLLSEEELVLIQKQLYAKGPMRYNEELNEDEKHLIWKVQEAISASKES